MKKTWLLCLFLFCLLAVPVQGQAPTATPARLIDPTAANLAACGLPESYSRFSSAATVTTFEMSADCTISNWMFPSWGGQYMAFVSGEFTINGNGYSIIGPSRADAYALWIEGANTIVNLNDLTIRESEGPNVIRLHSGRLNGRRLTFIDNVGNPLLYVRNDSQAYLENVRFLDNIRSSVGSTGIWIHPRGFVDINGGIFRGNVGNNDVGYLVVVGSTLQFRGRLTFENNLQLDGTPITLYSVFSGGQFIDRIDRSKPEKATARPSATPRPRAMTCIDLHQASGIAVRATFGLGSGIQCQRLNGGGIGIASIVNAGFIDAVDIWGYAEQHIEVCFPQTGELLFLDARTIPRAVSPLASYTVNGMTCGEIDSPGSIVLMPLP